MYKNDLNFGLGSLYQLIRGLSMCVTFEWMVIGMMVMVIKLVINAGDDW